MRAFSLLTVTANILVIIAFVINPQLRTINNYLIINLAFADLVVGLVSMNFYTAYIGRIHEPSWRPWIWISVMRGWDFGPVLCDAWLTLDYVASNTSVMNLLIISIGKVQRKKTPFLCNSVYFYEKTVNIFLIVYKIVTYQLLILLNIGISEKVIPFITFLYGLYRS